MPGVLCGTRRMSCVRLIRRGRRLTCAPLGCALHPPHLRAHGAEGIKNAVRAGVDSIEHGSLIDDEGIRLMKEHGTWLVAEMQAAYQAMHAEGLAHSVEVWRDDRLVGGLYGVALGRMFFGESMVSLEPDASKIALAWLSAQLLEWEMPIVDCQMATPHLASLGARGVPRRQFTAWVGALTSQPGPADWRFAADLDPVARLAEASKSAATS